MTLNGNQRDNGQRRLTWFFCIDHVSGNKLEATHPVNVHHTRILRLYGNSILN